MGVCRLSQVSSLEWKEQCYFKEMYVLKEDHKRSTTAKDALWNQVCVILVNAGIFQYVLMEDKRCTTRG